jgi:ELWxxDGT repeat protein
MLFSWYLRGFLLTFLVSLFLCGQPQPAHASGPARLLEDMNKESDLQDSYARFTRAGAYLYFLGWHPDYGNKLWRTDGTAAGTVFLPITGAGQPEPSFGWMQPLGNKLCFVVQMNGTAQVWVTDGTTAGTKPLTNFEDSAGGLYLPAVTGDAVYFVLERGYYKNELWKTNGTAAGTLKVYDFNNADASGVGYVTGMTWSGSRLYLTAVGPSQTYELYQTDGTPGGTSILCQESTPADVLVGQMAGNKLIFTGGPDNYSLEPWVSDGTCDGTHIISDLNQSPIGSNPLFFTNVNDSVFFAANGQSQVWKTDGSQIITASAADEPNGTVYNLVPYSTSGLAYIRRVVDRDYIYVANGQQNGSHLVLNLPTGVALYPSLGGMLFFESYQSGTRALWVTNGTLNNATFVSNLQHVMSSQGGAVGSLGNKVYFINDQGKLSVTDGTSVNVVTSLVPVTTQGSDAKPLTDFNGDLIFEANVGSETQYPGVQVFRTGGDSNDLVRLGAGTVYYDTQAVASAEQIFFNSQSGGSFHLSISHGLANDALQLPVAAADIGTIYNDILYFGAGEPWVSNGTPGGTSMLANLDSVTHSNCPVADPKDSKLDPKWLPICLPYCYCTNYYEEDSAPKDFVSFNGDIYFSALGSLYKIPFGTEYPRVIAQGSYQGDYYYYPYTLPITDVDQITVCGGHLYFRWQVSGSQDRQLWMTDGTTETLRRVTPGESGQANVDHLVAVGDVLYFSNNDSVHGAEPWRTDGTAQGTYMIADVLNGASGSYPGPVCYANGKIFFAGSGGSGRELYSTSGARADVALVKDIFAGSEGSSPDFLVNGGGTLYFTASELNAGRELWRSDGTPAGTVLVQDLRTGSESSDPKYLMVAGNKLYFQANGNDGLEYDPGAEPWVLQLDVPGEAFTNKLVSPVLQAGSRFGAAIAAARGMVAIGLPWNSHHAGNATLWGSKLMNYLGAIENPQQNKPGAFASRLTFAANGKVLAIGDPQVNSVATSAGAVYLFDTKSRGLITTIVPPISEPGMNFGFGLAGNAKSIAIGAPGTSQGMGAAAIYPLKNLGGAFGLPGTLNAPGRRYGSALAVVGSLAAVTSLAIPGSPSGSCELFTAGRGQFSASMTLEGGGFGEAVAGSKKLVAIAAPRLASYGGTAAGGAVFLVDPKGVQIQRVIRNPNLLSTDRFGESIAFTGKGILIGAPGTSNMAASAGAAYLFDLKTGNLIHTWYDPASGAGDEFGAAVAWEAKAGAIIGAPGTVVQGVPAAGAVYTYTAK